MWVYAIGGGEAVGIAAKVIIYDGHTLGISVVWDHTLSMSV